MLNTAKATDTVKATDGSRGREQLCFAAAAIVMGVIGIAGLAKLTDLTEFQASLKSWATLPAWLKATAVPLVPLIEVFIAMLWFGGVARKRVTVLCIVCLSTFTAALVSESLFGYARGCSCLGLISKHLGFLNSNGAAIARNMLFVAMLIPYLFYKRKKAGVEPGRDSVGAGGAATGARGFTMVELLVVIVILALLMGMALWGISLARLKSKETIAAARIRQHCGTILIYSNDCRETLPYFVAASTEPTIVECGDLPGGAKVWYFDSHRMWNTALGDGYYNGQSTSEVFRSPLAPPRPVSEERIPENHFHYPCVFLAAPEYWDLTTRLLPTTQFTATRIGNVRFSSKKVLLVHNSRALGQAPGSTELCAFTDGHATVTPLGSGTSDAHNDGPSDIITAYHGHRGGGASFMHTLKGVHGADTR